jgi:hypothetical protein
MDDDDQFNSMDRVIMNSAFVNYYNQLRDRAEYYHDVKSAPTFSYMMKEDKDCQIPELANKHTKAVLRLCIEWAQLAEEHSKQDCTLLSRIFLMKFAADAKRFLASSTIALVDKYDEGDVEILIEEAENLYLDAINLADGKEDAYGSQGPLLKCTSVRL